MRRFRLSIGSILVLIAVCGVAFAALKNASAWWTSGLVLGDLCLFVFALMAIAYRRGGRRAFWVGFALFGWAYLILGFAPGVRDIACPRLVTTKAMQKLWPEQRTIVYTVAIAHVVAARPPATAVPAAKDTAAASTTGSFTQPPAPVITQPTAPARLIKSTSDSATPTTTVIQYRTITRKSPFPDPTEYHRVGHALWALLLAIVGGGIARLLFVGPRAAPGTRLRMTPVLRLLNVSRVSTVRREGLLVDD